MEKQPSFDRIIGGTDDQKAEIVELAERESHKTGKELFGEELLEPTPEESSAICDSVEYANDVARRYGAARIVDPARVFVLKPGGVERTTEGGCSNAFCNTLNQSIAVERHFSNAILSASVAHESFHMAAYHSEQVDADDYGTPYRNGISMHGRSEEGEYFGVANEAIVATLTKRFYEEIISNDDRYKAEIGRTNKIKEWLVKFIEGAMSDSEKKLKLLTLIGDILILPNSDHMHDLFYNSSESDMYKYGHFVGFIDEELKRGNVFRERAGEREKFDCVLEGMVAKSDGKLTDKSELFDMFARAHFTGNYLPLARTIDGSLEKGAFRKIAAELGLMKEAEDLDA